MTSALFLIEGIQGMIKTASRNDLPHPEEYSDLPAAASGFSPNNFEII
jgi:hypothetical protein